MGILKYFFGYHKYNGLTWPMTWITENGVTVGGHPRHELDPREITEEEYNLSLTDLVRKYPRQEVEEPSTESG